MVRRRLVALLAAVGSNRTPNPIESALDDASIVNHASSFASFTTIVRELLDGQSIYENSRAV